MTGLIALKLEIVVLQSADLRASVQCSFDTEAGCVSDERESNVIIHRGRHGAVLVPGWADGILVYSPKTTFCKICVTFALRSLHRCVTMLGCQTWSPIRWHVSVARGVK